MILRLSFLAIFLFGLGFAVYAMLHGVVRSPKRKKRIPSPFFNAPTVAAFAVVFGATGYLLASKSRLSLVSILIIVTIAASIMTAGAIKLMARWSLPHAGDFSEEESAQGLPARVTRSISPSARGEISFQTNGKQHVLLAESADGIEIPPDTEVVIDTIQNGVARVELWSAVEQRL
jgi:hypothetical protein